MRRFLFVLITLFALNCAGDATVEPTACEKNSECGAGTYCGPSLFCIQDCDPTSIENTCETGLSCDPIGRCVVGGDCVDKSDCDAGPSGTCSNGDLISYAPQGTCDFFNGKGTCNYKQSTTPCEAGCINDTCILECVASNCTNAPSPACDIDGFTAVTYESAGFCENNGCSYTQIPVSCADGCLNGACVAGGCEVQPCMNPPNDRCSGNTVYSYSDAGTCTEQEGAAVCDYNQELFHCGYSGGECEDAKCVNTVDQIGGVVVVEYQVNPVGSFMDLTEWFEIVNTSGADIDLTGWIIRSKSTSAIDDEHIIGSTGVAVPEFPAGARLLFAREPLTNVNVDYDYPARSGGTGITFSNNSDWFRILNPAGEIVDHIFYESGSAIAGSSRKYDPSKPMTVLDNDNFKNWCPSLVDPYTGSPENFGTPGEVNSACAADPCSGIICEKPDDYCKTESNTAVEYLANSAMCRVTRFNNPFCDFESVSTECDDSELCSQGKCVSILTNTPKAAGDLIFSEVMGNPAGTDTKREYVEIYNTTANDLSLFGLKFEAAENGVETQSFQILDSTALVEAGGYVVLVRDVDPLENGGITGGIRFSGTHLKNTNYFDEGDLADPLDDVIRTLRLTAIDGTILDDAFYGNLEEYGAGLKSGISNQLKPTNLNTSDNDTGTNWCEASTNYGDGGTGTPGNANLCP